MSKIVWTNGCFDLLHPGHTEMLRCARVLSEGGQVVVGLDSDRKCREDKGNTRPINKFDHRKAILESIRYVDIVCGFDTQQELEQLIQLYNPDILLDGGDWREHEGVGRNFAKEVRFFNRVGGYSTTKIVELCKRSY